MNNSKSLGKGINVFFNNFSKIKNINIKKEEIIEIKLDNIIPNIFQPRKIFNKKSLIELSNSIKKNGILQPIIVRKKKKKFEIVSGERRFKASKLIKRKTIPVIIKNITDEMAMRIAILENLQREDLTSLEEAKAYNLLIKKTNLTQSELAKNLGKSRSYITNHLRLLKLPNDIKKFFNKNLLSTGQARTLLGCKDKKEMIFLAKKVIKKKINVRELEKIVYKKINKNKEKIKINKNISIIKINDKKGKIIIKYFSNNELKNFLNKINIKLEKK